jgi:hypothetical protein
MSRPVGRLACVTLGLVLAGCGYQLAGTATGLPDGARTIAIRLFRNHTREHGLEVRLRRAIEEEFRRRSGLRVVGEGESPDLVLAGDIRRFASIPVAFSATDEAVQYQGVIQVGLRLVDRRTNTVVRATPLLQETQDFGAVQGVVITSSPSFQRGTIDARDLAGLTNVQIGAARRREALRDLLDRLAVTVYQQAMEGF